MAAGMSHGAIPGAGSTSENDSNAGLPPGGRGQAGGSWTAGRVVAVVAGSVLALISLGLLGGGAVLLWADQALRHDGYLTAGTATYSTRGYALASDRIGVSGGWLLTGFIGQVRIRATAADPARPVFVAIGPADRVAAYLSGAAYTTVTSTGSGGLAAHYGTAVPAPPRTAGIWTARAAGTGMVTLRWTAETGDWMVVAMNPDGSPGLTVRAEAGVLAPWTFQLAVELIVGGIAAGALSAALIIVPVRLASGAR
jgi:hypothetical protein